MKALWLILIILLTIYAPLELSRLIIAYLNHTFHWQSIAELVFLWSFYVAAIVIIGSGKWLKIQIGKEV